MTHHKILVALLFAFISAACATTPGPDTPVANDPPKQCGLTEFVAAGECFATAEEACAALGCADDCAIQETAPARAVCSN